MEAGHRVAMLGGRIAAALGPANNGKPAHASGLQPGALLTRGETDIGLGPLAGPKIYLAVEASRPQPVLQRKVVGIADAHAPLLGAVDDEQAAERPERLAAQGLLTLLIEQDDALTGLDQLASSHEPGEASADDDGVCIHPGPPQLPTPIMIECRRSHWAAGRANRH